MQETQNPVHSIAPSPVTTVGAAKSAKQDGLRMTAPDVPYPAISANPPLLRIRDVATYLGFSDKTVRRLIDSGKLESVKIRGFRMVRPSSLAALIEKGT